MSKTKIAVRFKNIYQLWAYTQQIRATNMEIITSDIILICDCSNQDQKGLAHYGGQIIQGYHRNSSQQAIHQN